MNYEIIAHRGFSAIAPENTLAAFREAIAHRANSIEFDVQLSSDGIPVIIHDPTVERTTNGSGKVRDKTLEQLKKLDAGSWFSPNFTGETIPTLQEALKAIQPVTLQHLYVEVQESENWSATDITKLLETIISEGWQEKCIVLCFNENFLEQVREQCETITLGYLVNSLTECTSKLTQAATDGNANRAKRGSEAIVLSEYHLLLNNPSLVQAAKTEGVDIVAWTVDNKEELYKLTAMGIRRIVTNSLINRHLG